LLNDERLAAATGVSLRQVGVVRKSLVSQGLVQAETVRGRGTIYRFPAADSATLAAVIPSQPVETPVSATVPEPHPSTKAGTVNEQTAVLVAEMMERQMPDGLYLQRLQEFAGGPDLLLECLRWMVDQVDYHLGIPKYRFQADGHDLLAACIGSLCRSPQSPFLAGRRAKA